MSDAVMSRRRKLKYVIAIALLEEAREMIKTGEQEFIQFPSDLFYEVSDDLERIIRYGLNGLNTYECFYQKYYSLTIDEMDEIDDSFFKKARISWINSLIKQCKKEMKEIK